jgi:PAT family beta-lactamase induction signal transducer AmpG
LYFTQGTILSYFTALNALYFLSQGLTMTSVGIFSAIALVPFILKIFLGMLSDRVNLFGMGNRKPYIYIPNPKLAILRPRCLEIELTAAKSKNNFLL